MIENVIYNTDALSGLGALEDASVDCIVTSPPYWGLRDYGLEPVLFGGERECPHDFDDFAVCRKCGGWMGELGHEPSREMFLEHLAGILDECRRVLKETGTLWVNLGDSYCKTHKYNRPKRRNCGENVHGLKDSRVHVAVHRIPYKSLCNIPGLFAEMMLLRGWILRNEIIWYKPSVAPVSDKDRFTVDYEKLFFFTKSQRYYFEQQFEPYAKCTYQRYKSGFNPDEAYRKYGYPTGMQKINPAGRNKRTVWRIPPEPNRRRHYAAYPTKLVEIPIKAGCPPGGIVLDPFLGSGTTAVVARGLGCRYIGIEPNPEYVEIAKQRLDTLRMSDHK